jgi:hypothetical protein
VLHTQVLLGRLTYPALIFPGAFGSLDPGPLAFQHDPRSEISSIHLPLDSSRPIDLFLAGLQAESGLFPALSIDKPRGKTAGFCIGIERK